jgi:hypothetical protein
VETDEMWNFFIQDRPFSISPPGGNFTSPQTVLLDSPVPNFTVEYYYTLDGTEPTPQSTIYSGPIELKQSQILTAAAYKDGVRLGPFAMARFVKVESPPVDKAH